MSATRRARTPSWPTSRSGPHRAGLGLLSLALLTCRPEPEPRTPVEDAASASVSDPTTEGPGSEATVAPRDPPTPGEPPGPTPACTERAPLPEALVGTPFSELLRLPLTLTYETNGQTTVCELTDAGVEDSEVDFQVRCVTDDPPPTWACAHDGMIELPSRPTPALWRQTGCYVVRSRALRYFARCPATRDESRKGGVAMLSGRMLDDVTWTEPRYDPEDIHRAHWRDQHALGDSGEPGFDVLCSMREEQGMSKRATATTCFSPQWGYVSAEATYEEPVGEPDATRCEDHSRLVAIGHPGACP